MPHTCHRRQGYAPFRAVEVVTEERGAYHEGAIFGPSGLLTRDAALNPIRIYGEENAGSLVGPESTRR
jgi:hypothetical protein